MKKGRLDVREKQRIEDFQKIVYLNEWVKMNEPFSFARKGNELTAKLDEFKQELTRAFGNNFDVANKYLKKMDYREMNGLEIPRLLKFVKEFEESTKSAAPQNVKGTMDELELHHSSKK